MTATPSKPGWYADPDGGIKQRFWDGACWRKQAPSAKLRERSQWADDSTERDVSYAHIPPPDGAQWVSHWELDAKGKMSRQFHVGNPGSTQVVGTQYADGTVKKHAVRINAGFNTELSSKAARKFADELNAAADEIDGAR